MAGITLKGQRDLVSIMVLPVVLLKEKFLEKEEEKCKKRIIHIIVEGNAQVFCYLQNFENLVIFIRVVFSLLELFKEIGLNLMFEIVYARR